MAVRQTQDGMRDVGSRNLVHVFIFGLHFPSKSTSEDNHHPRVLGRQASLPVHFLLILHSNNIGPSEGFGCAASPLTRRGSVRSDDPMLFSESSFDRKSRPTLPPVHDRGALLDLSNLNIIP